MPDQGQYIFERISGPGDPEQCQASGNCPYKGVRNPNTGDREKFCPRHGGNKSIQKQERTDARLYLAAQWRVKIGDQADHPKFKSLREEVGILRMMLNNKLELIKDNHELMLHSQSVSNLVREVRDTLKTCAHVEQISGQSLDRNQALQFVQNLAEIISKYVTDPELLKILADEMLNQLEDTFKAK